MKYIALNRDGVIRLISLVLLCFLSMAIISNVYAQSKVVVIPMSGDDIQAPSQGDTFYYVPGALLKIHYDDGPADVYIDNSGSAIVRKTAAIGYMRVIIPIPLPAKLGGKFAKLVNVRVSYKVDNINSYITHTWLTKSNNSGGGIFVAESSENHKSTAYTSYLVDCTDPGCQLAWVPNGNYLTVTLGLQYGGIGTAHDITIGGVLLRVSYEG